ncbi:hypothetical protein [Campylobacter sp. RM16187]|uniref:hypothetical protein n=1 Tax=Campylobacter sp. RM16187 TaxID=1660063 RepID=UPI0021B5D957|nr:hypothetical protein [Campylobacter sp. RM16187]QKG29183.1 hypothetical protein CDOMF_0919 [Campylobacter sp. RM16187]
MSLNTNIFARAKKLQNNTTQSVVKVVYKNYQGYTLEIEPVELAVIKSSIGFLAQSGNSFIANARGKYGGKY